MNDRRSENPKKGEIASHYSEVAIAESVRAPFVYFDSVPAFGHRNGIFSITLEAICLTSVNEGNVHAERRVVAHLRMGVDAALSLQSALEKSLLMAVRPHTPTKN